MRFIFAFDVYTSPPSTLVEDYEITIFEKAFTIYII